MAAAEQPASPAIVWLHGAGMDPTVFSIAARDSRLAFARALRPQLKGASSIEEYAKQVVARMGEAGFARAALVGHSMGALIALTVAMDFPDRVAAVVLAGAAARMPVSPHLLTLARSDPPRVARMIARFAISPGRRRASPETPGISLGGASVALLERSPAGRLADDLQACASFERDIPSELGVPTLVVTGAVDQMISARKGAELASQLQARLAKIDGVGHMMMLERPQGFAEAVVPFLRSALLQTDRDSASVEQLGPLT